MEPQASVSSGVWGDAGCRGVMWGAVGCHRVLHGGGADMPPVPSPACEGAGSRRVFWASEATAAAWYSELPGAPRCLPSGKDQGARAAYILHIAFKHLKSFHADKKPHYSFKWF